MYLNIFLVVIVSLGIIFMTDKIKNKGVAYFLLITLIFLTLKKFLSEQKEYFENVDKVTEELKESVARSSETAELKSRISQLENNLSDFKSDLVKKTIETTMIRNEESETYGTKESQLEQDELLASLEREVEILEKLYNSKNDTVDETKYKSLPVFSSCKVNDMGEYYKNDNTNNNSLVRQLEDEEQGKNLGMESNSGRDLLKKINNHSGNLGNVDINFNLE